MLSKIYYAIGVSIISIYFLVNLVGYLFTRKPQKPPSPIATSLGLIRADKGKYVFVPSPPPSSGGSSYPSGGGYGGGK